ncbi:MAG: GlxA family transcriptional regulator [Agrobacterium tumefaciens]|nr:GlxA family transcriptional regulator [Agrobacterium tumefaciens]
MTEFPTIVDDEACEAEPFFLHETDDPSAANSGHPDLRVAFVLMNQFTLAPVAGFVDSLRFAADKSFRSQQIYCQWDWMTCNDQPVTASCGMPIVPTRPLDLSANYNYVVIAGGLLSETRNPPEWLLDSLRVLYAKGTPIIALCSGSFVLGKAGLLDGHRCAVHFTIRDEFVQRFPGATAMVDKTFIDDGRIITCPGGPAIDLASHLIRRHCGALRARKSIEYLLIGDERGKQAGGSSTPDSSETSVYQNDLVLRAIGYMKDHLDANGSLKEVAKFVGTHPRQLHRLFIANTNTPPANYWRKLKLERARKLLADTSMNITSIGFECGFSDASHFILWFRKLYGETPHAYRKRRHEVERLLIPA